MIEVQQISLKQLISCLNAGDAFTWTRYGDGEWYSILGETGQTQCGQKYLPALRQDLILTLAKPHKHNYYYGISRKATIDLGNRIYMFLRETGIDIDWIDSQVFHFANIGGMLFPFIDFLRKSRVAIVGPKRHKEIATLIPVQIHVQIPEVTAYEVASDITEECEQVISSGEIDVLTLSAGMASEVIAHSLHKTAQSYNVSVIDVGSMWDGYLTNVGKGKRGYMNRLDFEVLRKMNFQGVE